MVNIIQMVRKCDFLGPSIKLSIENKSIYKSFFGGSVSLSLIAICLLAFFGFGRDVFARQNPQVNFNRLKDDSIPLKVVTDNNLLFSYYTQDNLHTFPDYERRFTLSYAHVHAFGNGTIKMSSNIPLEKCQTTALSRWVGYFNVDPSSYFCFPKDSQIDVTGVMYQGSFIGLRLDLDYCQNTTTKTDCIPREDTMNLLGARKIQMHFIFESTLINSLNYTNPGNIIPFTGIINTNTVTWARLNILFKRIVVNTDMSYFLTEDINSSNFIAEDSIVSESMYAPATNTIMSHTIGNSKFKDIYTRKYTKLQDIFALMGGFINGILLILKGLVDYVAQPQVVDVFNRNYKFLNTDSMADEEEANSSHQNLKNIKFLRSSANENTNPPQMLIFNNVGGRRENVIKPDVSIIKKKTKYIFSLEMSCITRTFRVCCIKRDNMSRIIKIFFRSDAKFKQVASFENLMKITKFIKIIKNVILEDYQKEIIRASPLPHRQKINLSIENAIKQMEDSLNLNENKIDVRLYEYLRK